MKRGSSEQNKEEEEERVGVSVVSHTQLSERALVVPYGLYTSCFCFFLMATMQVHFLALHPFFLSLFCFRLHVIHLFRRDEVRRGKKAGCDEGWVQLYFTP